MAAIRAGVCALLLLRSGGASGSVMHSASVRSSAFKAAAARTAPSSGRLCWCLQGGRSSSRGWTSAAKPAAQPTLSCQPAGARRGLHFAAVTFQQHTNCNNRVTGAGMRRMGPPLATSSSTQTLCSSGSTAVAMHGTRTAAATSSDDSNSSSAAASVRPEDWYLLQFDGGSRGNPGISGAGAAIYWLPNGPDAAADRRAVWASSIYIGDDCTNNEAEYSGIVEGLTAAYALGIKVRASVVLSHLWRCSAYHAWQWCSKQALCWMHSCHHVRQASSWHACKWLWR
jgi:hypothetical protein